MATLPTLAKTWQFGTALDPDAFINQPIPYATSVAATAAALMFAIKESLIGFDVLPWTVVASSDGTSNAGAADYWVDAGDLVWSYNGGGTGRSWIVLYNSGLGVYVCLHLYKTTAGATTKEAYVEAIASVAGFTGGSVTARPTATDECVFNDALAAVGTIGLWGASGSINVGYKLHVMQSTDGECTRVIFNQDNDGDPTGFWVFDVPKNPVAGWTNPYVVGIVGNSAASICSHATLNDTAKLYGRGTTAMSLFCTTEGSVSAMVGENLTVANSFDNSWPMSAIGVRSATPSHVGRHAELYDLWFGSTARTNGDHYPLSTLPLYQFVQFDELILPWDSLTPVQVT